MAISAITTSMAAGVNYTRTTDNSTDWSGITGNTYFYDKTNKIVYYKNTSGVVVNAYDTFTGGTVSGSTNFISGLTANTISATTYQNLPTDVNVTGGTYSAGTITFTNNTGGTFNVTGLTTGSTATITGATSVGTGVTIFDSVIDRDIKINSITGDTLEKITTTLSANTIQVGINEQNLTLWPLVVNGNRLIDGSVSYVSGLTFDISPLNYIIDGSLYNIPSSSQVTLNSGDSTFDRIDVIFADISGNTGVLEGTPSANPEKPIVDSETQVEITFVSVPANSTTPTISTELIYDEFTGEPTEWNFLKFGNQTFRISGDSTAQSYSGSKSISVSGLTTSGGSWSNGFVLSATSLTDTNQFATLQFAIRNMSGNSNNTQIRIRFLNQIGSPISSPVYLWGSSTTGQYVNYSAGNTSSWQLISIPLWKFYLTNTNVYGVRFDYAVGSTVARHYFDKIELVEGTASSPPSNSWTTIKGDGTTTITAPNPNATLTISGGTNIGSFISGTSTVVLNLDNNINLNGVTSSTISATTYQNLPTDVRVTGGTYSAGTITFTNNTGGTFNVTGLTTGSTSTISGDYLPLSGGTVTGGTIFQSGLTANTISADTLTVTNNIDTSLRSLYNNSNNVTVDWQNSQLQGYGPIIDWGQGLIKDSGPSLSIDWINRTLNDGPEITAVDWGTRTLRDSFSGLSMNWDLRRIYGSSGSTSISYGDRRLIKSNSFTAFDWENGILTGQTNIQSSTISATTYQNLPDNVTGNYLPLSGGTVSGNTTITANLTVSGNSGINWFSSNTSSDLVRITQTGVGNAFVVEDNTNPDSTPFIINSGGSTNIGSTTYLVSSGGIPATLQVSNGTAGAVTLPITSTPLAIQSNSSTTVSLFSPNAGSSQFSFGSPSDSYASIFRYTPSTTSMLLSTTTSGGLIDFQSGNGVFAMRINSSQNIGIGTTNPSAKLHVVGDELVTGTLTATTISATTYQNLPDNVTGRYLPLSGGTVTGNTIFTSGLTANTLNVTGNTNVRAFTGTTGYISGSGQNILTVIGSGNSTTSPLFSVQGSSGELFSVTDSLVGSLFSVNDISGLPIMEVFSDNTTLWGSYQAPSLNTTTRTSLTAGTNTIYSIPTSAYTGAFYEYTLISTGTTGARAGQIMSIWSGSTANFTETSTTDIGTTTGVTFTVAISGNNAVLSSSATTAGWTVKTIIRSI